MWIYMGKQMEGNKGQITLKNKQYYLTYACKDLKSFNLFSFISYMKLWPLPFFCNHNTITQHVEETYLDKFERIWRSLTVWVCFCAG